MISNFKGSLILFPVILQIIFCSAVSEKLTLKFTEVRRTCLNYWFPCYYLSKNDYIKSFLFKMVISFTFFVGYFTFTKLGNL